MGESFRADDARDLDPPRFRLPRAVRPPVAPIVRPGLIEYPPHPGWPYERRSGVRRIKLSVILVILATAVLVFIAYQVVSGFLGMINGLVN
ncbi:hypothetical protein [Actinokineospora sp.]|uniref:hypothetical protein n=1 Tax=Actinokineospora sp. TaxID=1872133 RepID=UPI003D6B8A37